MTSLSTYRDTGRSRIDILCHAVAIGCAAIVLSWLVGILTDRVPLDYLGDEAARLLFSYEASTPTDLVSFLSMSDSWVDVHPPGDAVFKGIINWAGGTVIDSPSGFVRLHQLAAWASVASGIGIMAHGVRRRWGLVHATLFLALAVAGSPSAYVAHHAIGEAFATLLVALAVHRVLTVPMERPREAVVAALPLLLVTQARPEAAVVFTGLAVIPLLERRWLSATVFAVVSTVPFVIVTALIELTSGDETYASIRRFPEIAFLEVVTDERMREIIWGFGVVPFAGVAIVGMTINGLRRSRITPGSALGLAWVAGAVVFTAQIAIGAIHQQERAFLFPALFGIIALAALIGEQPRPDWVTMIVLAVVSILALSASYTQWSSTYQRWSDRVPPETVAASDLLSERSEKSDAILLDWLWWQEWRVAVYASQPGLAGPYCNYFRCLTEVDQPLLDSDLTAGLDPDSVTRITNAAAFLRSEQPQHIVMFSEQRYEEWLAWRASQDPFPSFVQPLLEPDGECMRSLPALGAASYCPILSNDHIIVLERQN